MASHDSDIKKVTIVRNKVEVRSRELSVERTDRSVVSVFPSLGNNQNQNEQCGSVLVSK